MIQNRDPPFFDILVHSDQQQYLEMRESLSSDKKRYQRYHRTDTFDSILEDIKKFCVRHDGDDWKRSLVCGVCWLKGCIGINVKQLMLLLNKSKSNINGVLAKIGYVQDSSSDLKRELIEAIPFLRLNYLEQRFWTIRVNPTQTPVPSYFSSSEISSPEMPQFDSTPQPKRHTYPLIDLPGGDEIKKLFNVIDLKIEAGKECGIDPERFDFFADPVCCCPAGWISQNSNPNDIVSYA